jgi:hypothetical protein
MAMSTDIVAGSARGYSFSTKTRKKAYSNEENDNPRILSLPVDGANEIIFKKYTRALKKCANVREPTWRLVAEIYNSKVPLDR